MKRLIAACTLVGAMVLVAACAPGGPTESTGSPIFDRARTSSDELPAAIPGSSVDADTSRWVGTDTAGNKYWAAYATTSHDECIVFVAAGEEVGATFCGAPGLSATTESGLVMEFASSPNHLDPEDAELVGDTIIVQQPS